VVRRPEPAGVPRDRLDRSARRIGRAVPVPGAARDQAEPGLSRLRRADSIWHDSAGRPRRRLAFGPLRHRHPHRHLGRRSPNAAPMSVA
jgi:hypothetical protein